MKENELLEALARHRKTLSIAESYTGGRVLERLTAVPGSSRVLQGGVVAYADRVKQELLDVRARPLAQLGAVSPDVALEMAQGALRRFHTDYAVATTGIAGPTGGGDLKPLGLSFAASASLRDHVVERAVHEGDRERVRDAGTDQALTALARLLARDGIL